MNPGEAARIAGAFETQTAIPTHYHFEVRPFPKLFAPALGGGKPEEFEAEVANQCPEARVEIVDVGATWTSASEER